MTEDLYDVAVVGVEHAQRRLADAGIAAVVVLDDCDLSGSAFDESTHTWALPTCRARIVITNQTRCGRENLAPYLGVAVHGAPNYFTVTGADAVADLRLDYVAECLKLMQTTGSTRIEVLFSTQRVADMRSRGKSERADLSYWKRMRELAPTAFDLSSHIGIADEVCDDSATIRVGDIERQVRVRLSGRLDPIDGRYHWQGTVFDSHSDELPVGPASLTIDERTAACRITERTQQGGYSVSGVGAPPYSLDEVEVVVPGR
jgi:hypothetical protein